jgi:L-ascorbate metabolism protein UlaG (beta-lactamase superfamily)
MSLPEPRCSFTFVGNATALLRFGPFTVLTDPNFLHKGQFAYLGKGLVSRRLRDPAMQVEELPALDAIVLSHMHGDHWDRVAKAKLDRDVPILTTPKAARALRRQRFGRSEGLATWETAPMSKDGHRLTVTAMPGRHALGPARRLLPPVMGSLFEYTPAGSSRVLRLYVTGDTLLIDDLREIPARVGGLDVAVLHLGGTTLPGGLVVTMDGAAGAELVSLLSPGAAVPVHFDDYGVFHSPLADFLDETRRRGLADVVRVVDRGETVEFGK